MTFFSKIVSYFRCFSKTWEYYGNIMRIFSFKNVRLLQEFFFSKMQDYQAIEFFNLRLLCIGFIFQNMGNLLKYFPKYQNIIEIFIEKYKNNINISSKIAEMLQEFLLKNIMGYFLPKTNFNRLFYENIHVYQCIFY